MMKARINMIGGKQVFGKTQWNNMDWAGAGDPEGLNSRKEILY